jgi:hypothetical protein
MNTKNTKNTKNTINIVNIIDKYIKLKYNNNIKCKNKLLFDF